MNKQQYPRKISKRRVSWVDDILGTDSFQAMGSAQETLTLRRNSKINQDYKNILNIDYFFNHYSRF